MKIYKSKTNLSDGTVFQFARFEPEAPVGVIQIIHGLGEHIGNYEEFAEYCCKANFACVIHDQRGHGNALKNRLQRGITRDYEDFLTDIKSIRYMISEWYPDLPAFLFGHSMGGNIALNYLLKHSQSDYRRAIIQAPWLRLYNNNKKNLVPFARFLGRINYKFAATDKINLDLISRDAERVYEFKNDEFYHNRMSFKIFAQVAEAGEYAIMNAENLALPVLLLNASEDKIVCPDAIRELGSRTNANVEYIEYKDGYHALHNDIIKDKVYEKMLSFCGGIL
jgi:lysophospholipase